MITDCFFEIGTTHKINEDYAISSKFGELPFVALSDGCSSSLDTDFGSRILVKNAKSIVNIDKLKDIQEILADIWMQSLLSASSINGLGYNCLDATLLMAWEEGEVIKVIITGDGAVSAKAIDGNIYSKIVSYPSNCPLYLSYHGDPDRRQQRAKEYDISKNIKEIHHRNGSIINETSRESYCDVEVFEFNKHEFTHISLFSDGVESFNKLIIDNNTKTSQPIQPHVVFAECMSFKNSTGEFVRRRCQRFLETCKADNKYHTDDFSMATIFTEAK